MFVNYRFSLNSSPVSHIGREGFNPTGHPGSGPHFGVIISGRPIVSASDPFTEAKDATKYPKNTNNPQDGNTEFKSVDRFAIKCQ
jgi:hypothetical protein